MTADWPPAVDARNRTGPGAGGDGPPAVEFDDVSLAFDEKVILRGVSFSLLPGRMKIATFVDNGQADFEVKNLDGEVVFKGKAGKAEVDPDTKMTLRQADFSDLKAKGTYYVEVPGRGRSAEFRIADGVFEEALEVAMLGLTGQRCGVEVDIVREG